MVLVEGAHETPDGADRNIGLTVQIDPVAGISHAESELRERHDYLALGYLLSIAMTLQDQCGSDGVRHVPAAQYIRIG